MSTGLRMLLFASLTIALIWTVDCQTPITCTAGQYKPGEKATIICHFHGEVSTDQNTGVYITWFDLHAPKDSSGKEVLMCHFSGGAVSVCKPEDGYRFVSFKNNLTIEVPDVSAEFQGRYSCGVVPADGRTAHPCFLLVDGAFKQEKSTTPKGPETHGKLHKHVETTHTLVIITFLIIIIIIIIIVAAAAIVFVAYKKKWFFFGRKDRITNADEEKPMVPIEETDNGGKFSVGFRPDEPGSVKSSLLENRGAPPGPVVELGNSLPPKNDTDTQGSHGGHATAVKEKPVEKQQPETEKDRKAREKKEKEDKARKIKEREHDMKERLKKTTSKEEKVRIQKEYDEIVKRSHNAETEEAKKRMREQYDEMTEALKNTTSEEEKKRIQAKYDDEKEQWKTEKEQKKKHK